jgi:hypothetical protein
MDAVNVYVPEPRRYSTIDFLLQCPKAFIAEVHVSTVRFIERSVSPYHADPEADRLAIVGDNFDRLTVPARIALLADRQGSFLGKMLGNASPLFKGFPFRHPRITSTSLFDD